MAASFKSCIAIGVSPPEHQVNVRGRVNQSVVNQDLARNPKVLPPSGHFNSRGAMKVRSKLKLNVPARTSVAAASATGIAFVIAAALMIPLPTSAASVDGKVSGTVLECGPGTIVRVPGVPLPTPAPTDVVLIRGNRTYSSYVVKFRSKTPWIGSFTFQAPAARYEVVVALPGYQVSWVTVLSGRQSFVAFRHFACPL